MKLDPAFLAILVCPICKGPLDYQPNNNRLVCRPEKLAFPVNPDGIPILLAEKATDIDDTAE